MEYFLKIQDLLIAYYTFLMLNNSEKPAESLVSESEKNVQRFYQSCLQVEATNQYNDKKSRNALLHLLDQIGGLPLINEILNKRSFMQNEWDFQQALETAHNILRADVFFHWRVDVSERRTTKNTTKFRRHVIQVRPDKYGVPQGHFFTKCDVKSRS